MYEDLVRNFRQKGAISLMQYAINSKLEAIPRHKLKKTYGRISPWMQNLFDLKSQVMNLKIIVRWYSPMVDLLNLF